MKSFVLYVALAVLFVDFINAKSLKTKIFRERRSIVSPYGNRPHRGGPPPQRFPLGLGGPNPGMPGQYPGQFHGQRPGQFPGQFPGQMRPPMPGQPGPMGQSPMGAPGCGGCAQNQGPKMCPAICMRWNTIIKPNGQVENGPASITPLAPNEKVGPNGVFPPMTQMMGPMQPGMMQPGMMQPGMMQPGMMQQPYMQRPGAGFTSPIGGAQPPPAPPPAGGTAAPPKPTQG